MKRWRATSLYRSYGSLIMPKGNVNNLRTLTSEQAREIGRKGGKASAEAKRVRREWKETLEIILGMPMRGGKVTDLSKMKDLSKEALEKVGLGNQLNKRPNQMSGGQMQRVAIARAVIANPQLILADEPTGNLDSKNGQEVMELLSELNREGTTIIMVTHSQHDSTYAHRVLHLFDGTLVKDLTNKL